MPVPAFRALRHQRVIQRIAPTARAIPPLLSIDYLYMSRRPVPAFRCSGSYIDNRGFSTEKQRLNRVSKRQISALGESGRRLE